MNLKFSYLSLFFLFILSLAQAQPTETNTWQCELTISDQFGPIQTYLEFEYPDSTSFTAYSPKNADRRSVGWYKSFLGRLFNKLPKKGRFINITDGRIKTSTRGDSLFGTLTAPVLGKSTFKALRSEDAIYGSIYKDGKLTARLSGSKTTNRWDMDYPRLTENIADTTAKYIYNPQLIQSKEWKKFAKKLSKTAKRVEDDVEYFIAFSILSGDLPFSHYRIVLLPKNPFAERAAQDKAPEDEPDSTAAKEYNVSLDSIDAETAYMDVKNFSGSAAEMDSIFDLLLAGDYENLIVDLRENGGGGLNSAIPFGEHLAQETVNAGYFLTNKWYSQNLDSTDFEKLPVTQTSSTEEFINQMKTTPGQKLVVKPGKDVFQGKVYILTGNKTASTCEPIVYALKNSGRATIVGQKTAGAMLSGAPVHINDQYYLFLPMADYYTSDGKRLDQVGVQPDVEVKVDQALEYVLNSLK